MELVEDIVSLTREVVAEFHADSPRGDVPYVLDVL
jgi:hypothetical protein